MSTIIQLGIVVGYLVVALAIGVFAYRVTESTAEDYYLASRTFGTVVLLFTVFATLLSAFTFFGGADTAYLYGPEWILVMGLMDGLLFAVLWYVIGYKQWLIGRRGGYVTLGEMLGDRFGSLSVRVLVASLSLFWLFPYVMLQQIGAGGALRGLTDGAVPYWVGATLITVFMMLYVVLAGIRGIAWTDTLQGAFMIVAVWTALLWVLGTADGVGAINAGLAAKSPEFFALGSDFYTPSTMLTLAISIAFGVAMFPQVNQRFFTAGSKTVLKRSFALWPVLVLLLFVPAFLLGTWARGLGIDADIAGGEHALPILLAELTPGWFAAIVIAGALAAMMSSSDSMLLSGSSYFTRDIYRPLVTETTTDSRANDQHEAWVGRAGVVVFALAALAASLLVDTGGTNGAVGAILVDIGDLAFGGFAQLSLPVIVALYWRGTTRDGILAGMVVPQVVYVAFNFLAPRTLSVPVIESISVFATTYHGWGISIYCMLIGLFTTLAVSAITTAAADEETALYFDSLSAD